MFKVSLIVPAMLTKSYLELLWHSFKKNTADPNKHQFIVHVNGNFPEILEFCKNHNIGYTTTEKNEGIPYAFNASMNLIEKEYMMLMNDDMYLLPGWDDAIERSLTGDKYDWRSPIMLYNYGGEAPWAFLHCPYGNRPKNFEEKKLLKEYKKYITNKVIVHQRPPMVIKTEVWKELKGWDRYFDPGPGGDPDFAYRFWQACGKDSSKMQSVPDSLIYHFGSATYAKTHPNYGKGHSLFFKKWGVPIRKNRAPKGYQGQNFRGILEAGKVLFERK